MKKNYIGFVNDHSGSMVNLTKDAMTDFNANIKQIKDSATEHMIDTIVSVVSFGKLPANIEREIVLSNPHVLRPLTSWKTCGGTPLYDAVANLINLFKALPDANKPDVSFLIIVTTDGEDNHSTRYRAVDLKELIKSLDNRWTIVCRVPKQYPTVMNNIGIPIGNIQIWDTTQDGLDKSSQQTQTAIQGYYAQRVKGKTGVNTFYSNTSQVNISKLNDITKEVSLYVVEAHNLPLNDRLEIEDFILQHRMQYLKGAAFYQLTKTEARIGPKKKILIRDRNTGKIYHSDLVRDMLGLPKYSNARLHPGEHGNFDIFIQSESTNRLLVLGTGVIYWEKIGTEFTEAERTKYNKKEKPDVVKLPAIHGKTKPTPSPIPSQKKITEVIPLTFKTRALARAYAKKQGLQVIDLIDAKPRWRVM
jgi:hypothetical protein